MRFFAIALVFSVAACDSDNTSKPDLSMGGDDIGVDDDLSTNKPDQATPDLSPLTPSGMIQAVRNAADGVTGGLDGGVTVMAMPVEEVFVTYLKPTIVGQTFDTAGFFVQAEANGPALFVDVDPAGLTPVPVVGDKVSFTVNAVSKNAGIRQANKISGFAVASSGNSLTAFVQDLSAKTDVVTALDSYESELSKIDLTISSGFITASGGYVAANATSAGVTAAGSSLKVRLPLTLRDTLDVNNGCVISVGPTPMWRFNAVAEPSAFLSAEVVVTSCPMPQVVSAVPVDATHVLVTFDRNINPATLTAGAFTFDNGLVTMAAAAGSSATQVSITTTAGQTAGLAYTITVAASVQDTRAQGVDAAHNTARFHGFTTAATLQITEFTPGISNNHDLIELIALSPGTVTGFTLQQDLTVATKLLATLPDQVVATNDVIVVHIQPSPSPAPTNDFALKTDCTAPSCYALAWDANGVSDIGNSARVIVVKDALGNIQDGVAFYNKNADADAAFITEMQALVTAGRWTCAASPCVRTDAPSSSGADNSAAGKSLKRTGAAGVGSVANWPTNALAPSTYGTVP